MKRPLHIAKHNRRSLVRYPAKETITLIKPHLSPKIIHLTDNNGIGSGHQTQQKARSPPWLSAQTNNTQKSHNTSMLERRELFPIPRSLGHGRTAAAGGTGSYYAVEETAQLVQTAFVWPR